MSVISQGELLAGIYLVTSEAKRKRLKSLFTSVTTSATILPVDEKVARAFADIYTSLRKKGRPVESNDIWIAATAMAHSLIVVTNDQHFAHIDGLSLENWTSI